LIPQGVRPHLKGTFEVIGSAPANSASPGSLILNGLLIEGALSVLAGNLAGLGVAHCTLGPGMAAFNCANNPELALAFERAVSGELKPGGAARSLQLTDCIVDGNVEARALVVESSTVFGVTAAQTLEASNSIFVGLVTVERRQTGCARFSYLPFESQSPRRYQCQPRDAASAQAIFPKFSSATHGDAEYAMLATTCPPEIGAGADDEGEMGAWHYLQAPLRVRNLRLALDEYLRFGLEAGISFAPQRPIVPPAVAKTLIPHAIPLSMPAQRAEGAEPKPPARRTRKAAAKRPAATPPATKRKARREPASPAPKPRRGKP
jgi:hypothetical protein